MTGTGRHALFGLAAIALLTFAWVVWPTPWRYFPDTRMGAEHRLVRIHRITGDVEVLISHRGWISAGPP